MSDFLAVLAIFKNETRNIREWLDHYLWQGADRFYLIDNGSTDNPLPLLANYPVQYSYNNKRHAQVEHYERGLKGVEAEWVAVVDLDEFMYGVERSLAAELADVAASQVVIPWRMFGAVDAHPQSVRDGCTMAWPELCSSGKYIVRAKDVTSLGVHYAGVAGPTVSPPTIRLNHYPTQSWEWFSAVKMSRGCVASPDWDDIRNEGYFHEYNRRAVAEDRVLADLVRDGYRQMATPPARIARATPADANMTSKKSRIPASSGTVGHSVN